MRIFIIALTLMAPFYTYSGKVPDSKSNENGQWVAQSTGSINNLSEEQKLALEDKSKKGDAEASFRLYRYYCFTMNDINGQMKYLKISASQGNIAAQYNYGVSLSDVNPVFSKYYDLDEAIYWIKLAVKNGDNHAKSKLEELNKLKGE